MADRPSQTRIVDWFTRWRTPLRRFLAGKGVHRVADLEDVSQEVFLRLLRYDGAEMVDHPRAYLFKVASNVAAEWAMRAPVNAIHSPSGDQALPSLCRGAKRGLQCPHKRGMQNAELGRLPMRCGGRNGKPIGRVGQIE